MGAILSPFPVFERCNSAEQTECWTSNTVDPMISRASSAPATLEEGNHSTPGAGDPGAEERRFQVVNWNVAAPNNNPFEYWALHDDARYNELMGDVQKYIDQPGTHDLPIGQIFTHEMYMDLKNELTQQGTPNLDQLDHVWASDLMIRKSISEFLKDKSFGEKRLISMPDRMTSSVKTESGQQFFRPSPMTGIKDDIGDIPTWWELWKHYMFRITPCMRGKPITSVYSMLEIIPRAKYPALTIEEEALSLPLQTLCLALFDAVFIYLLSCVAPETWQPLKRSLHEALFENKAMSCVSILQRQYSQADVIFVQEASESFSAKAGVCLDHFVLRPQGVDGRRLQMSLILLRRSVFIQSSAREVTDELQCSLQLRCVEKGDLCVFEVQSREDPCLLASFHGDSNGKSTVPVLAALEALARERYPRHTLLFGLDGNTVSGEPSAASPLSVARFSAMLSERGVASCWGGQADLAGVWTTFNARTYLQPQLQKAVGLTEVLDRRNMQLKDWVLFFDAQLVADGVVRDNTGAGAFVPAVMPSQRFPSDHAIVAVTLRRRRRPAAPATAPASAPASLGGGLGLGGGGGGGGEAGGRRGPEVGAG